MFFYKIKSSFKAATKGQETIKNLIWRWGAISYFLSYFVVNQIIKTVNLRFFDIAISLLMTSYFSWHIYVLKKCCPKKSPLTKEEKEKLREQTRKQFFKRFLRKIFLQEPISELNPITVVIVIDVFALATFLGYIF